MKALKIILGITLAVILLAVGCTAIVAGTASDDSPSVTTSSDEAAPSPSSEAPAPSSEEPAPAPEPEPQVGGEKDRAVEAAKNYIDMMGFSEKGLTDQLVFDGFNKEDAAYGAANAGADWEAEAAESAKNYIDMMPMSRSALIDQLVFDGYTSAQAEAGADAAL